MIVLIGIPRITRMFLTKEEKPTRNIPGLWTCKLLKPASELLKPASELLCKENSSKSSYFCKRQSELAVIFLFLPFWKACCLTNELNWLEKKKIWKIKLLNLHAEKPTSITCIAKATYLTKYHNISQRRFKSSNWIKLSLWNIFMDLQSS